MPPENAPRSNEVDVSTSQTSAGPLAGIIIIIFLLFVGAFYILNEQRSRINANPPPFIPGDAPPAND